MNWEAIGAIGEIVGAVAVVFSLIYLAGQVRANARQSSTFAEQDIVNKFGEVLDPMISNERFAAISAKALTGEELTPGENISYISNCNRVFNTFLIAQQSYENGHISQSRYDTYCKSLANTCNSWPQSREILKAWLNDQDPGLADAPMFRGALESTDDENVSNHWGFALNKIKKNSDNET